MRRRSSSNIVDLFFLFLSAFALVMTVSLLLTVISVVAELFDILRAKVFTPENIFRFLLAVAVLLFIFISWKIYELLYFHGKNFCSLKERIRSYVDDCNQLNQHIEDLKNTHLGLNQLDYGHSSYYDNSRRKYKRPELQKQQFAPNVYNCSRSVCDNAGKQPFKYICKYFDLKPNEETLSNVEAVLNNFEAAIEGQSLLMREKADILSTIQKDIPFLIRHFSKKKTDKKLGFEYIDLRAPDFPTYIFQYVSAGGNASLRSEIVMDIDMLNRFIEYLSQIIKFKKSVAGQRALMTSRLRSYILERDNYTCKHCGASISQEPNLLLEVDHILPLSKGGLTTEDNLQTLCWRCNRMKGAKVSGV